MTGITKIIGIAFAIIITSFFFFPFVPSALPMVNTKMILAGIGLVWALYDSARQRDASLSHDFFVLSIWAAAVSLIGLFAMVYNNTPDSTYATYIISMWVWMGGAYTVTALIRNLHGQISVRLLSHYLIAVCALQCILAFEMNQFAALKGFIDSLMVSEGYMGIVEDRLYGLGASLDVAGMRFSAVLIIIVACLVHSSRKLSWIEICFYLISFVIIGVVGNMIGRTTTVGLGIALAYIVIASIYQANKSTEESNLGLIWRCIFLTLVIFIPVIIYLYNNNPSIQENIRFAFEGFFSIAEKGHWETTSNNNLVHMVVFPDEMKTWIIGDGYFDGPSETDPYYTGPVNYGFYKYTDIGYLRFIFYFGLLGTLAFALFMLKAGEICIRRFPKWAVMFTLILILNYIVWFKVSSDLFSVFALYICIQSHDNEQAELNELSPAET